MPTSVISPYAVVYAKIKAIIETEFTDLGVTVESDKLHGSLGWKGIRVAVYPDMEAPQPGKMNNQITAAVVQFYGKFTKEIDPEQAVDPQIVTEYAERFRRAFYVAERADAGTKEVWFMQVISVTYPDDPTGNKTRFEAIVRAYGQNQSMIEVGP